MKEIKCICGVIVPQTPGKKQRIYCTPKCKQKDWQAKRREVFSAFLGKMVDPPKPKVYQSAVIDKKSGGIKVVNHKVASPPVTVSIAIKSFRTSKEVDIIIRNSSDRKELEAIKYELTRNEMIPEDKKKGFNTRIDFKLKRVV